MSTLQTNQKRFDISVNFDAVRKNIGDAYAVISTPVVPLTVESAACADEQKPRVKTAKAQSKPVKKAFSIHKFLARAAASVALFTIASASAAVFSTAIRHV